MQKNNDVADSDHSSGWLREGLLKYMLDHRIILQDLI